MHTVRGRRTTWGSVPVALIQEPNITLWEIKVYIALSSFQGQQDTCWPSRDQIAERSALHSTNVSKALTSLEKRGWVEKMRRGKGKTNVYYVLDEVAVSATSTNLDIADSATSAVADSTTSLLYTKTTKENNISDNALALFEEPLPQADQNSLPNTPSLTPSKKELSPMKDPLANIYQNMFTELRPAEAWGNFAKERKSLVQLSKATERLFTRPEVQRAIFQPIRLAQAMFGAFLELRQVHQSSTYWKCPIVPSALLTRWDTVVEKLTTDHAPPVEVPRIF